ncbi:hypothetical protein ACVXZY_05040 [Staphylococcus aureus]
MAEHSFDVNEVIKDFPILDQKVNGKRLAYLDSTATSQTPVQVLNVLEDYYKRYEFKRSSWCSYIRIIGN